MNIKQFIKDRDEALLSLDKEMILAYCHKYGARVPDNELIFWASVHKAICGITTIPQERKDLSIKWLKDHGFSPEITISDKHKRP